MMVIPHLIVYSLFIGSLINRDTICILYADVRWFGRAQTLLVQNFKFFERKPTFLIL